MNNNPDTYVAWLRTDEPGEDPRWESQCGVIIQTGFGNPPIYWGYVGQIRETGIAVTNTTTLASAKRFVETEFQKTNTMKWSYDGREVELAT